MSANGQGVDFRWLLAASLLVAHPGHASEAAAQAEGDVVSTPAAEVPVYRPPLRGAPRTRVGGGTRGGGDSALFIEVLAPEQTGLTHVAQPALYWYLSRYVPARYVFVLIAEQARDPVIETTLAVRAAGMQAIALADYGHVLEPGMTYEWSVTLAGTETPSSADLLAGGTLRRVEARAVAAGVRRRADTGFERARQMAAGGLWYDALHAVNVLIADDPANAAYRDFRTRLLETVGLAAVSRAMVRSN